MKLVMGCILAGIVPCLALSGCVYDVPQAGGPVAFSPDGRRAACPWIDMVSAGYFLWSGYAFTEYVAWCDLGNPENTKCTHMMGWASWVLLPPPDAVVEIAFSPDSRHIGVRRATQCLVIDAATGEKKQVTPVAYYVSSFAWQGPDEIVYVTHEKGENGYLRRLWRQRITAAPESRVMVYEGPGVDFWGPSGGQKGKFSLEQWSPDGRRAVAAWPVDRASKLELLDATQGRVRPIGNEAWSEFWVSWKRDGSQVLCVGICGGPENKGGDRFRAILLSPATLAISDISDSLRRELGGDVKHVAPLWTADGKVAVTRFRGGAALVDPVARKVLPAPPPLTDPESKGTAATPNGDRIIQFLAKDKAIVRPAAPAK